MKRKRGSVGRLAWPLVERLLAEGEALGLGIGEGAGGCRVVDAGIICPGGHEAGRRIAEICMAGLGTVAFEGHSPFAAWPFSVCVHAGDPVTACLLSQYAGWALAVEEGGRRRTVMISGPGRARARREALFEELDYTDDAETAVLVLESDRMPSESLVRAAAEACRLPPSKLVFLVTPTASLAGLVQITARVLEVALHKVHELNFPLDRIVDGIGRAPLPPLSPDLLTAMGRSNDAILFGGEVWLTVTGPEAEARALADALPSSASRDYGRPFAEIFRAAQFDFYAIDRMLFSPARVRVTAAESGRSFAAGRLAPELLERSFGG